MADDIDSLRANSSMLGLIDFKDDIAHPSRHVLTRLDKSFHVPLVEPICKLPDGIAIHGVLPEVGDRLSLTVDSRPGDWTQILEDTKPTLPDPLEHSAGPLDEFSSGWSDQTFDSSILEEALTAEDTKRANAALFNSLMVFEAPSDLEFARRLVKYRTRRMANKWSSACARKDLISIWRVRAGEP